MAVFSVIKKSALEGAERIDAEYYQPSYLEIERVLKNTGLRAQLLRDLIKRPVVTGTTPKIREALGDGSDIKFIKTDSLREGQIVFDNADVLPVKQSRKNSEPQSGDILVTIIGATYEIVGRAAKVFAEDPKMNINQNVVLVRPSDEILSGYLETFLRSKFGRHQLWQQSRQTEQVNLNCREVELIRVPVLSKSFQQDINELVEEAHSLLLQSEMIYSDAEKKLLQELGVKESDFEEELSYVVDVSEVSERTDAEYFQPKYSKLVEKLRAKGSKKLGELISIKKGIEPGAEAYQDEGKLFIRVSSLSKFGVQSVDQKYLSNELYQKLYTDFQPQVGEILLTKDATPGIAYVVTEAVEGIISGGILRLKLKTNIDTEYLALCLNSLVGQMQVERDAGGSVIKHWRPDQVKNIEIPFLPKETQQKIGDLVQKSHAARKKSKELLEQAKHHIEELIEKGTGILKLIKI